MHIMININIPLHNFNEVTTTARLKLPLFFTVIHFCHSEIKVAIAS